MKPMNRDKNRPLGTEHRDDLFVQIERMTADEYKNGGQQLSINYSFVETPVGQMLTAATPKGVCYMAFCDDPTASLTTLQAKFPKALYHPTLDPMQQSVQSVFTQEQAPRSEVKLHLKGTDFQLKVWRALLTIPLGGVTTYGQIAAQVNHLKASRAVGTAIGSNPVAVVIPCHRVIRSTGGLGGYHWGLPRKIALIDWEAARIKKSLER